jgi:signal transduction histidine kinase
VASATGLELVSTVAHELQTPLAAVRGAVTALRERAELDDATRDRLLAVIDGAAAQMARLVDDLLAAGRLEAGRPAVHVTRCDARLVADAVVAAAREHLREGVSLRVRAVAGLPDAVADPDRLRQVLANLVDNAVKHARGSVEVRLAEEAGRIRLTVSDDGPGIQEEDRERIFERFERGAETTPGTGLGLYLARELVAAMGGALSLESEVGKGSAFTVELSVA